MTDPGAHVSDRWAQWRRDIPLDAYHQRFVQMEAEGRSTHGEADFIDAFRPSSVLDAGCGMGRVAIELQQRGYDVEGVDLDADLLAYARRDAAHMTWHHADLASLSLQRQFGLVAMPGNVMIFCRTEDRCPIVAALASHLEPAGLLVAGFGLDRRPDALTLAEYDECCAAAGLHLVERFSTWDRDPYQGGDYAVSVHRLG